MWDDIRVEVDIVRSCAIILDAGKMILQQVLTVHIFRNPVKVR